MVLQVAQAIWKDFELVALQDLLNGTSSVIDFNLNPKRVSRTTYGITGTVTFSEELIKYEVGT